jgi:hypothetical protein
VAVLSGTEWATTTSEFVHAASHELPISNKASRRIECPLEPSVASDVLLVLVVFVPERGAQERIGFLRRGFAELPSHTIPVVATLDGCNRRAVVGPEILDSGAAAA